MRIPNPALLLSVVLACELSLLGQVELEWEARHDGPGVTPVDSAVGVALDGDGNVAVLGKSCYEEEQYPTFCVMETVKYDPEGNVLWKSSFAPSGFDLEGRAIVADGEGNLYVTGGKATVKYDRDGRRVWEALLAEPPGRKPFESRALAVDGAGNVHVTGTDLRVVKYDPDGEESWISANPGGSMAGESIVVDDATGWITVGGGMPGGWGWFGWAPPSLKVVQYDAAGQVRWEVSEKGARANDVVTDSQGNVYVAGFLEGDDREEASLLVKYAPGGQELWRRTPGPTRSGTGFVQRVVVGEDGAGEHVTFASTVGGYLTARYSAAGDELWVRTEPASASDKLAIAVGGNGSVHVAGSTALLKYDRTGELVWRLAHGMAGFVPAADIAVDPSGAALYVAGEQLGTVKYDAAGAERWRREHEGLPSGMDEPLVMTTDADANVFVAGLSNNVAVLVRYDASGNRRWVRGTGLQASSMATDDAGNLLLLAEGNFRTRAVIKYSASGNELWSIQVRGNHMAVDGEGNVHVVGLAGEPDSLDGEIITVSHDSQGLERWRASLELRGDAVHVAGIGSDGDGNVVVCVYVGGVFSPRTPPSHTIVKYDRHGNELWKVVSEDLDPKRMVVDRAGNVYIAGGGFRSFKYGPDGERLWSARYTCAASEERPTSLAVDGEGNVYVVGRSCDWSSDCEHVLVIYDAGGNERWVARLGPTDNSHAQEAALAVDDSGVHVAAEVGLADLADIRLMKLDPLGNELWSAIYDEPDHGRDSPRGIAVNPDGSVYVVGDSRRDFLTLKYVPSPSGGHPLAVSCTALEDRRARLIWSTTTGYEEFRILRDDLEIALLPGTSRTFDDPGPLPLGTREYTVEGRTPGGTTESERCSVNITPDPPGPRFLRGDVNTDGTMTISDALMLRRFLFSEPVSLPCWNAADANDDGRLDVSDAIIIVNHIFAGGGSPARPFPEIGVDPTPDGVGCDAYDVVFPEETEDVIRLGDVAGVPGQEVEIPVLVSNSKEVEAFQLIVQYDPDVFIPGSWDPLAFEGTHYDEESNPLPGRFVGLMDDPREGYFLVGFVPSLFRAGSELPSGQETLAFKIRGRIPETATPGRTMVLDLTNGPGGEGIGPLRLRNELTHRGESRFVSVVPRIIDGLMQIFQDLALFNRGDADADGDLDISDPLRTLAFLFKGGEPLSCLDAADANDDGHVDISDAIHTLGFLFLGGDPIPPAGVGQVSFPGGCGFEPIPDDDGLDCECFEPCLPCQ